MMHKIKRVLGLMKSSPVSLVDIFENNPQCVKYNGDIDCQTNGANSYGTFEEAAELTQSKQLSNRLMDALRNVREKLLHCELLIPCGLIMKVSEDIVRMSHSEPCGIRGCILYINLKKRTNVNI
uniref:Uncharacterized protein n=1 Tax=Pinctada fucata TaxID=50426 RepID=A0A194AMQ5_PINFU